MKRYFIIFLLSLGLFTTPSQGYPICRIQPEMEGNKTEGAESARYRQQLIEFEQDPEKSFVKVYGTPDMQPKRYIFTSYICIEDECQPLQSDESFEINDEFVKCRMHSLGDRLFLKCTPKYSRPALMITTKFLQINDRDRSKMSALLGLITSNKK